MSSWGAGARRTPAATPQTLYLVFSKLTSATKETIFAVYFARSSLASHLFQRSFVDGEVQEHRRYDGHNENAEEPFLDGRRMISAIKTTCLQFWRALAAFPVNSVRKPETKSVRRGGTRGAGDRRQRGSRLLFCTDPCAPFMNFRRPALLPVVLGVPHVQASYEHHGEHETRSHGNEATGYYVKFALHSDILTVTWPRTKYCYWSGSFLTSGWDPWKWPPAPVSPLFRTGLCSVASAVKMPSASFTASRSYVRRSRRKGANRIPTPSRTASGKWSVGDGSAWPDLKCEEFRPFGRVVAVFVENGGRETWLWRGCGIDQALCGHGARDRQMSLVCP